jgi:hypothetical protein
MQPHALFAAAIADPFEGFDVQTAQPPLPDVREEDGWVLSSLPIAVRAKDGGVEIDRHRQAVSPEGQLTEEVATITLDAVSAEELEQEGREAGFQPLPRRRIAETRDHVGSTVVMLRC